MIYFKDANPKIVYSGNTYELMDYATPEYSFNEHDFILHTSVINGKKTLVSKGTYCFAKLNVFDLTYSLALALKSLIGKVVTFYPYGSGNHHLGGDTYQPLTLTMLVTQAKFYHRDQLLYKDAVILEMESQNYTSNELTIIPT